MRRRKKATAKEQWFAFIQQQQMQEVRLASTPPDGYKIEAKLVTPEWARHIIEHGKYNRRESKATWKRYARDMAEGKWTFSPSPIVLNGTVDEPGLLLDGYHRLMAIIGSNTNQHMLVVSGMPEKVLHVIDSGRPRSLGQRFEIDGEHAPRVLADLIKYLKLYHSLGCFSGAVYTVGEYYELLETEPGCRDYARLLVRKMPVSWLKAGLVACCWYLFAQKDADKAAEFCEGIITGENLSVGDPMYAFRDWVSRLEDKNRKIPRIANTLIDCWNKFRRGETVQRLRPPADCPEIE